MQKFLILKLSRRHVDQIKLTHYFHSDSRIELNRVLNGLSKSGRVDDARQMFEKMAERDEFAWNTIISAYANSGRLTEAMKLFNETPSRSPITWSSIISGYCKYGFEIEAFEFLWQMQFEGQRPSQYTLGSVLRLCSTTGALVHGEKIHGYAIKIRLDDDFFVVTALIDMYAKCNCIFDAEYVFETVADKKYYATWTAMLTGYSHNGDGFKAIEFFRVMRAEGIQSNQFTFPSILTACGAVSSHKFGMQVHGCIVTSGFFANAFVQSALVDMYAKCRDFVSAKSMLQNVEADNVVSWNAVIVGCVRQGFEAEALSLFQKMNAGNMKTDNYTYPSVLNACASLKDKKGAYLVHCLVIKTGFEAYKLVDNALIDAYAKLGEMDYAFRVFNQMTDRDVVSWTSLVTGYSHNGAHYEAVKLFCEMRTVGVFPDQVVVSSILSSCAELTVMDFGKQVHANVVKLGIGSSLSVDNALVTMYAKCGDIISANRVFDFMNTRSVISWTALILGFAQNGRGKDSLQFYEQMISSGTKPDYITFVGLLFACSHNGFVENAHHYFDSMDKVYGIAPGPEHYACMIDLLGRSGKLSEARELLAQMVVEPDAVVWKALLAACRVHGELELGEMAAKKLFKLEPTNAVPYVLLCNMYSATGRWEEAAKTRRLMKSNGISKEPGRSWIEKNSKVHTFLSEDRNHPMKSEIYSKIDEMITLIKEAGYVPDMNFALHDMDEEGKELGLAYHSEKLAVAFGLLTLPLEAPIRIFKNLRICGDCHTAMKFISRVYKRHIVLRDANCFHHFTQGKCSCGDYW